ncbi:K02A2.6-like [Cordylochernes scorpioides]|uniref:K02A2.6-like n=1 Tax=Cordylochernes scorpioides TaxID=51811 RepID=A0ABY6LUB4_9ARAC|nr:K02A2.6-like [Cordylochernes scorpioides]
MPPATISEWTWPEKPWHRLHLDLAGPFMGRMFLVLVDAYSKLIEIFIIKDITRKTIISHLREILARIGLPQYFVTDNGRQFISGEFEQFTKMNGIRHTKTSPYNPSTNGLAERYVREFKTRLRKNNGKDDLETNLQSFLFAHRAFPQTVIKEFPGGTANEEKFKIKILEFNTKMRNPREVFHEAENPPKKTTAIFLDLTSAFDRVWREKLREKLHNIGTYSLESRRQNKNNLDRHFGNEEPEDEISLTTCGLVDPPFSENEVKLTAFKFGKRKSSGPEGIDNTVVKALGREVHNHSSERGVRGGLDGGLNKGAWVLFVALDIDGAFNSMSWNKLMGNLMDMGCPDYLCSLVRDFLRDRRISLSFGGRKLERNCARGCPQGSCCGPILWNILVNTVFQEELPEGARLVLYADDQFLIIEAASRAKAEKDQKVATNLERVQRTGALRITGGYRTTSSEAFLVLAGLILLGLKLEEETIRQKIWENREYALGLEAGALESKRDPRKPPQWLPKWNWSPGGPTGIGTEVFTDCSKSGTNTGAGVMIFTNGELIFQESLTLRVDELVFSAELVAIRVALRVCAEKNFSPDRLYSDCVSALVAINLEKGQLAHQIIQELEMMTRAPELPWFSRHSLIEDLFLRREERLCLSIVYRDSVFLEENIAINTAVKFLRGGTNRLQATSLSVESRVHRRRINARRIFQKFGVAALNEHIEKHWFQNLKTEDISLCDAPRSDQFSGLNKKALKTDIEEENSLKR